MATENLQLVRQRPRVDSQDSLQSTEAHAVPEKQRVQYLKVPLLRQKTETLLKTRYNFPQILETNLTLLQDAPKRVLDSFKRLLHPSLNETAQLIT